MRVSTDWTPRKLAELLLYCIGVVAIVGFVIAIVVERREPSGKGREALERLREGTVEIIADGVEKGVRRASGEDSGGKGVMPNGRRSTTRATGRPRR